MTPAPDSSKSDAGLQRMQDLLTNPLRSDHLVLLHEDERLLVDAVALYAQAGLGRNEGVMLVATVPHLRAVEARLEAAELPVQGLTSVGQLVTAPVGELLVAFMRAGLPDAEPFEAAIVDLIRKLRTAGYRRIRVFGEMVDLLWRCNLPAAVRLEELWNDLARREPLSLFCACSLEASGVGAPTRFPSRLRALHTHAIPVEAG